jgi:hypothetical protein
VRSAPLDVIGLNKMHAPDTFRVLSSCCEQFYTRSMSASFLKSKHTLCVRDGLAGWGGRTRSAPGDRQGVGGASPLR